MNSGFSPRGNPRRTQSQYLALPAPPHSTLIEGYIAGFFGLAGPGDPGACSPTGATSCRFLGLNNTQTYGVEVSAVKENPIPVQSFPSKVKFAMPAPLPSGPRNFRILGGSSSSVTVSWDAPEFIDPADPIAGYLVFGYRLPEKEDEEGGEEEPIEDPEELPLILDGPPGIADDLPLFPTPDLNAIFRYPLGIANNGSALSLQITGLLPGDYQIGIQAYTTSRHLGAMNLDPLGTWEGKYAATGLPTAPSDVVRVNHGRFKKEGYQGVFNGGALYVN